MARGDLNRFLSQKTKWSFRTLARWFKLVCLLTASKKWSAGRCFQDAVAGKSRAYSLMVSAELDIIHALQCTGVVKFS